jgi:hypothetical protein
MKKNLLALVALAASFSVSAQTAYIKDQAVVAVKPNTLLYMGNGLELSSDNKRQVINEGNIYINLSNIIPGQTSTIASSKTNETTGYYFNNFKSDGKTKSDGSNFVNTWTALDNYGQVRLSGNLKMYDTAANSYSETDNRVKGKMTFERPYLDTSKFNWYNIGIPFYGSDPTDAVEGTILGFLKDTYRIKDTDFVYIDPSIHNNSRYSTTVMQWDNNNNYYYYRNEPETSPLNHRIGTITPFMLNLTKGALKEYYDKSTSTNDRVPFVGSPRAIDYSTQIRNTSSNPWSKIYKVDETYATWANRTNPVGEKYNTYIGEASEVFNQNSTTYGKYLLKFANPFTHNIDLAQTFTGASSSGIKYDLKAVQKIGNSVTWSQNSGNTTTLSSYYKASIPLNTGTGVNPAITSKSWTGDKEALILRPFEIITFKLDFTHYNLAAGVEPSGDNYTFYLEDTSTRYNVDGRTFSQTTSSTSAALSKTGNTTISSKAETNANSTNSLYQLGLALQTEDGSYGNRIYAVASNLDITGNQNQFELDFGDFGTNSGVWLLQENKDETYDNGSYLYINGFNMNDYVAKPLRISFYKNPKDSNTKFTFTANLAEESTINDGLDKFSNGNKFYFVDTKENKTIEVTKDFKYTFTATENSNERFVLYWNALPKTLGIDDTQVNKNKTFVYKNNGSSNAIRFAKKNLTANVQVFNMNGQLLSTKDNVNTSQDYSISNLENGMYVILIKYSNNTVETLKSIFKK